MGGLRTTAIADKRRKKAANKRRRLHSRPVRQSESKQHGVRVRSLPFLRSFAIAVAVLLASGTLDFDSGTTPPRDVVRHHEPPKFGFGTKVQQISNAKTAGREVIEQLFLMCRVDRHGGLAFNNELVVHYTVGEEIANKVSPNPDVNWYFPLILDATSFERYREAVRVNLLGEPEAQR